MKRMKCSSGPDIELLSTNKIDMTLKLWRELKGLCDAPFDVKTHACAHMHLVFKHFDLKMAEAVCSAYLISLIRTFCRELLTLNFSLRARAIQSLGYTDLPI